MLSHIKRGWFTFSSCFTHAHTHTHKHRAVCSFYVWQTLECLEIRGRPGNNMADVERTTAVQNTFKTKLDHLYLHTSKPHDVSVHIKYCVYITLHRWHIINCLKYVSHKIIARAHNVYGSDEDIINRIV